MENSKKPSILSKIFAQKAERAKRAEKKKVEAESQKRIAQAALEARLNASKNDLWGDPVAAEAGMDKHNAEQMAEAVAQKKLESINENSTAVEIADIQAEVEAASREARIQINEDFPEKPEVSRKAVIAQALNEKTD